MSDTPRTDACQSHQENIRLCVVMERELAAANERISTLKAALIIAAQDSAAWQENALEIESKLNKATAFIESLVTAGGPHSDINGSSVIQPAYNILQGLKS